MYKKKKGFLIQCTSYFFSISSNKDARKPATWPCNSFYEEKNFSKLCVEVSQSFSKAGFMVLCAIINGSTIQFQLYMTEN